MSDDNDSNTGKTIGGAAIGATIGSVAGPAGTVAGGVIGAILAAGDEDYDHNVLVTETFDTATNATPSDTSVYVDHVEPPGAAGNPDGELDGVSHVPDVLVQGFAAPNTIIEVETPTAIANDPDHILDQLDDFRVPSYQRILVVPEPVVEDATRFVEETVEGPVDVATPDSVSKYL
ncbi:hypothetical protein [Halorussus caseinilyticus]|uniref:Glycine zipper domain-containing protein n=1 Tax=Halorussus caseinilyticus TaxID=3034025 RepID=A0ABD5WJ64_9EURY|nr:hypothetical protein [Halorussus sp. DT72]